LAERVRAERQAAAEAVLTKNKELQESLS